MQDDTIVVRRMTPALRTFTALVWGGSAGFFAWLAWRFPTAGHEFGYALGLVFGWMALYVLRLPEVVLAADADGFTYADTSRGLLLVFPEARASWSDVRAVDTREVTSRYGSYLRTRLTLRGPEGDGTRRVTLTSRATGYLAFLDRLRAATSGAPVEVRGYGADAARARDAVVAIRRGRMRVLAAFALLGALLIGLAWLTRR